LENPPFWILTALFTGAGFILKDNVEGIWFQEILKGRIGKGEEWGRLISSQRDVSKSYITKVRLAKQACQI